MRRSSVVLGLPLSLAMRAPGLGSVLGKVTKAVTALTVMSPWIGEMSKSLGTTLGTPGAGGLASFFGSVLTFADMNAQVVTTKEQRRLAIVSIPGRESDFLQDLGGHSVKYKISGKFFVNDPQYNKTLAMTQQILQTFIANGATGSIQMLRLLMRTATPVPFMCEHDIAMVVIQNFNHSMVAGEPLWVNYEMDLVEYTRIPYVVKMAMLGVSNAAHQSLG